MSYNISSFRTRSFKLELPLNFDASAFIKKIYPDNSEEDEGIILDGQRWYWNPPGGEFEGVIQKNKLVLKSIYIGDDWSGDYWEDVFKELFRKYGELDALVTWEDGDSIYDVKIKKGKVVEKEIN